MDEEIVIGLSIAAVVGAGFRAALLAWALKRGEVTPETRGRARIVAVAFGVVALVGAVALLLTAR